MQQFKNLFSDPTYVNTFTNVQKCLRLNDLHEVGDKTHRLIFEMIGLFSFRQLTLPQSIDFMVEFLRKLKITPDYVTIHPDKISSWSGYYEKYNFKIKPDLECKWSDGNIGGYCTEFYKDGIEIGNIVNPLDTCIDVGFGLERLLLVSNSLEIKSRLEILEETSLEMINLGVSLGNNKSSYVLKKLITESVLLGSKINHPYFIQIKDNQKRNYQIYLKNKDKKKYENKPKEFWLDTFGVDITKLPLYDQL